MNSIKEYAPTYICVLLAVAAVAAMMVSRIMEARRPVRVISEQRVYQAWTNMTKSTIPYEDWSVLFAAKLITKP